MRFMRVLVVWEWPDLKSRTHMLHLLCSSPMGLPCMKPEGVQSTSYVRLCQLHET